MSQLFVGRNYCWIDEKGKKSRLSAPQYVDFVMTYCQKTINDETVFPTKHGMSFHLTNRIAQLKGCSKFEWGNLIFSGNWSK